MTGKGGRLPPPPAPAGRPGSDSPPSPPPPPRPASRGGHDAQAPSPPARGGGTGGRGVLTAPPAPTPPRPRPAPLLSPTDARSRDLRGRDILRAWSGPGPLGIAPLAGAARSWARAGRPEGHGGPAGRCGGLLRGAAPSVPQRRPVRRRPGCGAAGLRTPGAGGGGARPPGKPLERHAGRGAFRCGGGGGWGQRCLRGSSGRQGTLSVRAHLLCGLPASSCREARV